ncbi:hypothetical protein [Streptomyces sp. NPDC004135]
MDEEAYDFHIDAKPDYKSSDMRAVLEMAESRGLEPLDPDECAPEILEDGTVRIYLTDICEEPELAPEPPPIRVRRAKPVKQFVLGFALAACIAGVLTQNTPLPIKLHVTTGTTEEAETVIEPMSSNKGVVSGTESQGTSAAEAPASESVGSEGRVGKALGNSVGRGKADRAHTHDDLHRLRGGQVEPRGLAESHGPHGGHPTD